MAPRTCSHGMAPRTWPPGHGPRHGPHGIGAMSHWPHHMAPTTWPARHGLHSTACTGWLGWHDGSTGNGWRDWLICRPAGLIEKQTKSSLFTGVCNIHAADDDTKPSLQSKVGGPANTQVANTRQRQRMHRVLHGTRIGSARRSGCQHSSKI